jgi:hypothetical protein
MRRVVLLVSLLAIGPVLAGCSNFDPDSLDVFGLNEKKKLPGERKELFPGGVPGVTQGIPPQYVQGNQQTPEAPQASAAAAPPAEEAKPKAKPKPRTVSRPTRVTVQPASQQQQQQQPAASWPEPQQQQQQPAAQSPWPAPNQSSSTAPWPSSPAPGTFSKQ